MSRFREDLLSTIATGVYEHTLNAFWQYIIYSEIILKIVENDSISGKKDATLLAAVGRLEERFFRGTTYRSGDFSERIYNLVMYVSGALKDRKSKGEGVRAEDITNIIFRTDVKDMRRAIASHIGSDRPIMLLFDNIDKGWPARGLEDQDVKIVRSLIDALSSVARQFSPDGVRFKYLVFLRNDVYEHMLSVTPDRGKDGIITIDWKDKGVFKTLIKNRLVFSGEAEGQEFEAVWHRYFPELVDGVESFDFLLARSLMRPRFLIDLIEKCVSHAVNSGRSVVDVDDIRAGCYQHSLTLISEFVFELRDVCRISDDLFYWFIGVAARISRADVMEILTENGAENAELVYSLLLWYGFLGVESDEGAVRYIYHFHYDWRRMQAEERRLRSDELRLVVNEAFLPGLE